MKEILELMHDILEELASRVPHGGSETAPEVKLSKQLAKLKMQIIVWENFAFDYDED